MTTELKIVFHDAVKGTHFPIVFPLKIGQTLTTAEAINEYQRMTKRDDIGGLLGRKRDGMSPEPRILGCCESAGNVGIMKGNEILSEGRYILLGKYM